MRAITVSREVGIEGHTVLREHTQLCRQGVEFGMNRCKLLIDTRVFLTQRITFFLIMRMEFTYNVDLLVSAQPDGYRLYSHVRGSRA